MQQPTIHFAEPLGETAESFDLPVCSRMLAGIYDALTRHRPYRAGMSEAQASAILDRERGTKLCQGALNALAKVRESRGPRS